MTAVLYSPRSNQIFFVKIGRRLQHRRVALGLSQEKLARLSGLDRAHLSAIENGRRRHPTLPTLRAILKPLRISISEFLRGL